jgi:predicted alpha/beta superfamily hydrolase
LDPLPISSKSFSAEEVEPESASAQNISSPSNAGTLAGNPRYQVHHFHSKILADDRTIQVYLPRQYTEEDRRFPVFYLHDGQNLFDGQTSYIPGQTWNAHTTADRLILEGQVEPAILVGIANAGLGRMAEYTPTRDVKMGGGDGPRYGRMLIEELKPWIDGFYRTLPDAANTGLGGSSLGGLISLYLGWKRSDIFSKLAVMSPSLWWDHRSILGILSQPEPRPALKIWLDMGTGEGTRHLRDADLLERMLFRSGWQDGLDLIYRKVDGAVHDERAWSARFGDVLGFLFPVR